MLKHKTLTVLERRIEETQACLMRAKARYDPGRRTTVVTFRQKTAEPLS